MTDPVGTVTAELTTDMAELASVVAVGGQILVVDYAFAKPTMTQLKAAKVVAVGRYTGQAGPPKNMTHAEVQLLTDNGIDVFTIFEFGASQALGGAPQAATDIALFKAQRKALGQPEDRPVYVASDFDIQDYAPGLPNTPENAMAKLGPAGHYYKAWHDAFGPMAGAYGGYWLIKRVFDAGLVSWGFQTVAWSGNQWDARAQLRQMAITTMGNIADVDVPERKDFGQWNLKTPTKPVTGVTKAEALAAAEKVVAYLKQ